MSGAAIKEDEARGEEMMLCASCGTAGSDDIKLMKCTACYLVSYCSVKCQKDHESKHKKACRRRAAELRDELLFEQPESNHHGDCPICCVPLPLDSSKSTLYTCCCKTICNGCDYANFIREVEGRLQQKCPFCRKAAPKTDEGCIEQLMKRIEANDPVAMCSMGKVRCKEGEYNAAFEYWTRAAALGDIEAHYEVSLLYREGRGVEKDEKKELYHLEQAAIEGHPMARHNLGVMEWRKGRLDRAAKHFIIAAYLGDDASLKCVKDLYKAGLVRKDDFATALRGHEATNSPQREEAAEFHAERKRRGI